MAHFYLTTQLLSLLEENQLSRIVNVSSIAHRIIFWQGMQLDTLNDESKYSKELAYGRSKTANILFTRELAKRLEAKGVDVRA